MGPSGNTRSSTRSTRTRTRTRTRTSTRTRKSTRNQGLIKSQKNVIRINYKEEEKEEEVLRTSTSSSSTEDEFPKTEGLVFEAIDDVDENINNVTMNNVTKCSNNNGCSTPKGQKFRIPEISTCPPAPKKRRVDYTNDESQSPSSASSFSVRRSPIAFFAPPDLELFFHRALRGISV